MSENQFTELKFDLRQIIPAQGVDAVYSGDGGRSPVHAWGLAEVTRQLRERKDVPGVYDFSEPVGDPTTGIEVIALVLGENGSLMPAAADPTFVECRLAGEGMKDAA